jgi:tripeptidyl-peptidase-1
VIEAFRPSQQTEQDVREWLMQNGIPAKRITHSDNRGWFAFYATAEEAERLLYTEYFEYEDSVTGGVMPACEEYHLPNHIRKHIDYIAPGIKLLAPSPSKKDTESLRKVRDLSSRNTHDLHRVSDLVHTNPNNLSTCDLAITPACVAALYKIPPAHSAHPNNSLGVFESELQFYYQKDLDSFFTNFTNIKNGTHPIPANIDGGQQATDDPYYAGGEVNLDLMLAYPIVHPQTITLYQVDDYIVQANQNDTYTFGFNTFLDALDGVSSIFPSRLQVNYLQSYCTFSAYNETGNDPYLDQEYPDPNTGGWGGQLMCGVYKPTNVISLSYGGQESDVPISYQKRQCLEYLKLGLQGVSFLFASGDSGVSSE